MTEGNFKAFDVDEKNIFLKYYLLISNFKGINNKKKL